MRTAVKAMFDRLKRGRRPVIETQNVPQIRAHLFNRKYPQLFATSERAATEAQEGTQLISQLCRHATLDSAPFREWILRMNESWAAFRKLWEQIGRAHV